MIRGDYGLVLEVYAGLFVFGFFYNLFLGWLVRNGYDEGYMWLLVAGGAAVTLAGVAVVDAHAAGLALGAFAASGMWMAAGSWWRHVTARRAAQDLYRNGR